MSDGDDPEYKRGLRGRQTIFFVSVVAATAAALTLLNMAATRSCPPEARDPQTGECVQRGPSSAGSPNIDFRRGPGNVDPAPSRSSGSAGIGNAGRSFGAAGGS